MAADNVTIIQNEISRALKEVSKKYGANIYIEFKDETDIEDDIEVGFACIEYEIPSGTIEPTPTPEQEERTKFISYCENYGFQPKHYGRLIEVNGKYYKFTGFNPKARKNFCIFEREGRQYCLSIARTIEALEITKENGEKSL